MIWPINPVLHRADRLSDAEFFDFCQQNPKLRIERDETGQIFIDMPTGTKTSVRNADLIAEVVFWNRKKKSGVVTDSNGGFTLPDRDRKSTRLNSSHSTLSRMPSSA